jgi:hypothetical protein
MTAQKYLQTKLKELKTQAFLEEHSNKHELVDAIFRIITSKKFRKYKLSEEQAEHIKNSVTENVACNEPIKATLVFGGYKLWRLEEAPEADWAELFSLMYYTNWMKQVCEIYEAGVWFDFFSDDVIVPMMNNVPVSDTKAYQNSFKQLLKFIKPYQPNNLSMTFSRVGDQYVNYDAFEKDRAIQKDILSSTLEGGLPQIDDIARSTLSLNVKTTPKQKKDAHWQEKVQLIHDSYAKVKGRRSYYRRSDKFNIMTTPNNGMLAVGTTKDSIMKFWIGTGVLVTRNDSYRQIIMSPNQLSKIMFDWQDINIGIKGKNFNRIRIIIEK